MKPTEFKVVVDIQPGTAEFGQIPAWKRLWDVLLQQPTSLGGKEEANVQLIEPPTECNPK